jgi:hypothetical protein
MVMEKRGHSKKMRMILSIDGLVNGVSYKRKIRLMVEINSE